MYVKDDVLNPGESDEEKQYRFLVHTHMKGDGCRPTLKIQFLPGNGTAVPEFSGFFSEGMLYDPNAPDHDPASHLEPKAKKYPETIPGAHTNKLHVLYVFNVFF